MNTQLIKANGNVQSDSQSFAKPRYRVRAEESRYLVDVYLPGVSRDSAQITLEGDLLRIEATRPRIAPEQWQTLHRELSEGDFRLQLQLNVEIDADRISAQSANGVLTLALPIAQQAAPRAIAIEG